MKPVTPDISNHGFKPLILTISREEIESLRIECALQAIDGMLSTPQLASRNAGRLSLTVDGYAKGERIKKSNREHIRRYFLALDEEFNGWFHLCNRWDNTLRMLFLATTSLKEIPAPDSHTPQLGFDLSEMRQFVSSHNLALVQLHRKFDFPERLTEHVKKLMHAYFENYFLKLKEERV